MKTLKKYKAALVAASMDGIGWFLASIVTILLIHLFVKRFEFSSILWIIPTSIGLLVTAASAVINVCIMKMGCNATFSIGFFRNSDD